MNKLEEIIEFLKNNECKISLACKHFDLSTGVLYKMLRQNRINIRKLRREIETSDMVVKSKCPTCGKNWSY